MIFSISYDQIATWKVIPQIPIKNIKKYYERTKENMRTLKYLHRPENNFTIM